MTNKRFNFTEDDIQTMATLRKEGHTLKYIGNLFNCSPGTVSVKLQDHGITVIPQRGKPRGLCQMCGKMTSYQSGHCKPCLSVYRKNRNYKYYYGITLEEMQTLLEQQEHKCKLCGSTDPRNKNGWHVDHCHITGKVRGILCHNCNIGLGQLGDTEESLLRALKYIKGEL